MKFALLLDSGVTIPLRWKQRAKARAALVAHNEEHRRGMAERERCKAIGDYMNFPLVISRRAVGLVVLK